jgi:hypothetical protein
MKLILYSAEPYEGYYEDCLEVPDDFDLREEINKYKQNKEFHGGYLSSYNFFNWLCKQYPHSVGVLQIGHHEDDIEISKPGEKYKIIKVDWDSRE